MSSLSREVRLRHLAGPSRGVPVTGATCPALVSLAERLLSYCLVDEGVLNKETLHRATTYMLCDLGRVSQPLCASVYSVINVDRMGDKSTSLIGCLGGTNELTHAKHSV